MFLMMRCSVSCNDCVRHAFCFFFFKQKTAYEMRISDWSSDVCSSDLIRGLATALRIMPQKGKGPPASRRPLPVSSAPKRPERSLLLGFFQRALGGVGGFLGSAGSFGRLVGGGGDRKSVV